METKVIAKMQAFRKDKWKNITLSMLDSPLPLITLPKESKGAQTGWPDRPNTLPIRKHIHTSPEEAEKNLEEPNYSESNSEEILEISRTVVYRYGKKDLKHNESTDTIQFDSFFESGNLLQAERIRREGRGKEQLYELLAHPDLNNSAYRQWFYFEVKNGKPGIPYTFQIVNMSKKSALFGSGLQPCVYSEHDSKHHDIGWVHQGEKVWYGPTKPSDSAAATGGTRYTLSFTYYFKHPNDTVFFACLQPYTYTDLMEYLDNLEKDPVRSATFRRVELCQTLALNRCELLTIMDKQGIPQDERKVVVLSSRVHPGESNSSWMMKGMIDYLTGSTPGAITLRRNFIFKVIPMLNPDGVINGNTRVNLAGWDLNRKWTYPVAKLFPTIYYLKQLIVTLNTQEKVAVYCDLHGHSIHPNVFMYGCLRRPKKVEDGKQAVQTDPRIFPMIVSKNSQMLAFHSCSFKVQKSKMNTARVVVYELGITNSFTLEASFCGPNFGPKKNTQFTIKDLETMGRTWCQCLLLYYNLTEEVEKVKNEIKNPEKGKFGSRSENLSGGNGTESDSDSDSDYETNPTRPKHDSSSLKTHDRSLSSFNPAQKISEANKYKLDLANDMEEESILSSEKNSILCKKTSSNNVENGAPGQPCRSLTRQTSNLLIECESEISELFGADDLNFFGNEEDDDENAESEGSDCEADVSLDAITKVEQESSVPKKKLVFSSSLIQREMVMETDPVYDTVEKKYKTTDNGGKKKKKKPKKSVKKQGADKTNADGAVCTTTSSIADNISLPKSGYGNKENTNLPKLFRRLLHSGVSADDGPALDSTTAEGDEVDEDDDGTSAGAGCDSEKGNKKKKKAKKRVRRKSFVKLSKQRVKPLPVEVTNTPRKSPREPTTCRKSSDCSSLNRGQEMNGGETNSAALDTELNGNEFSDVNMNRRPSVVLSDSAKYLLQSSTTESQIDAKSESVSLPQFRQSR